MERLVLAIMVLVCFNFILKQTLSKWYHTIAITMLSALFVGMMWPFAIEQSKSQISQWLSNTSLMLDISIILTLEVILQMWFCMLAAHIKSSGRLARKTIWVYRFLRWFPGILFFPVLFCGLVAIVFSFPGHSFSLVAWCFAGTMAIVVALGVLLLRWLLPQKELRLELLFLANALIAILGIVATVNGQTAVEGIDQVEWGALGGIAVLVAIGAVLGLVLRNFMMKKHLK